MPKFDTMLSTEKVAARVKEMGAQISRDYKGKKVVVIGVLKGSFIFLSDLSRVIPTRMYEHMVISSNPR